MLIETLIEEREYLKTVISEATIFLKDVPEGSIKLRLHKGDKNFYCYLCPGGKYLSQKKDKQLIQALVQKGYEKKVLKAAMEQKAAIEKFLSVYNPTAISEIVEKMNPNRVKLISVHENFCKSISEASTEEVSKADSDVDLARNLIAICEAFLQSKGGSL